jgi:mRNA interferase MazF
VLLSRDESYSIRSLVTVAPVTTRVRGLPVEVALGTAEGLDRACVANLDTVTTIAKADLDERAGHLGPAKVAVLNRALRFALGLGR